MSSASCPRELLRLRREGTVKAHFIVKPETAIGDYVGTVLWDGALNLWEVSLSRQMC